MNKNTKDQIYIFYTSLVFAVLIIAFFFVMFILKNETRFQIKSEGKVTLGTLYETKGKYLKCKYIIDGEDFTFGKKKPYRYLYDSEVYEVGYLSEKPDYIEIYFDRPILEDNYEYDTTYCKSIEMSSSTISYAYDVDEKSYIRKKPRKSDLGESKDSYVVIYRRNMPQIGYLFNKP